MRAAGAARRHESERSDQPVETGRLLEEPRRRVVLVDRQHLAASPAAARSGGAARSARARAAPPCARATRSPCSRPSGTRGARAARSTIIASRSHLASTLAAATEAHVRSALTRMCTRGAGTAGVVVEREEVGLRRAAEPVVRPVQQHDVDRPDGRRDGASARVPASRRAAMMPTSSISAALACPTARASPQRPSAGSKRGRAPRARAAWSPRRPSGRTASSTSTTTTPTLTGPASEPRPTSSMPARSRAPSRRSTRSWRRCGATRAARSPSVRRAGSRLVGHVRERAGRVAQQSHALEGPHRHERHADDVVDRHRPPPGLPWLYRESDEC